MSGVGREVIRARWKERVLAIGLAGALGLFLAWFAPDTRPRLTLLAVTALPFLPLIAVRLLGSRVELDDDGISFVAGRHRSDIRWCDVRAVWRVGRRRTTVLHIASDENEISIHRAFFDDARVDPWIRLHTSSAASLSSALRHLPAVESAARDLVAGFAFRFGFPRQEGWICALLSALGILVGLVRREPALSAFFVVPFPALFVPIGRVALDDESLHVVFLGRLTFALAWRDVKRIEVDPTGLGLALFAAEGRVLALPGPRLWWVDPPERRRIMSAILAEALLREVERVDSPRAQYRVCRRTRRRA